MQRFIMAATLLLALGLGLFIDRSVSAQDAFSCDDFSTFDDAFDAFVAAGGPQEDPNGVDPDRDGFPCEDLDGTPEDARSAASNEYPSGGDPFVASWIVGSEAAGSDTHGAPVEVDGSFVGSAAAQADDDEPTGIGPYVGTPSQNADQPESNGIGSLVGGEAAWTDGTASDASVSAMPSTGVGAVESAWSGLSVSLMALFSVLALGAAALGTLRVRRD